MSTNQQPALSVYRTSTVWSRGDYCTAWGVKTMSEKDIKLREGEKASCLVTEAEGEEGEKR